MGSSSSQPVPSQLEDSRATLPDSSAPKMAPPPRPPFADTPVAKKIKRNRERLTADNDEFPVYNRKRAKAGGEHATASHRFSAPTPRPGGWTAINTPAQTAPESQEAAGEQARKDWRALGDLALSRDGADGAEDDSGVLRNKQFEETLPSETSLRKAGVGSTGMRDHGVDPATGGHGAGSGRDEAADTQVSSTSVLELPAKFTQRKRKKSKAGNVGPVAGEDNQSKYAEDSSPHHPPQADSQRRKRQKPSNKQGEKPQRTDTPEASLEGSQLPEGGDPDSPLKGRSKKRGLGRPSASRSKRHFVNEDISIPRADQIQTPPTSIRRQENGDEDEVPANDDDEEGMKIADSSRSGRTKSSKSSKRKSNNSFREDDDEEFEFQGKPEDELEGDAEPTTPRSKPAKAKRAKAKAKDLDEDPDPRAPPSQRGLVQGPWSQADIEQADEIFQYVCDKENLDEFEMKSNIASWKTVGMFREEMLEAFPRRTFPAIRKFCQRRYNPNERGVWTEEQNNALRTAYATYPDEWRNIGEMVGRFWSDCRDRWRNALMFEDTMERGPWSEEEEQMLIDAVKECLQIIIAQSGDPNIRKDRAKLHSMVDWKTVAEKMGGRRSIKRCQRKFQNLRRRRLMELRQSHDTDIAPTTEVTGIKEPKRHKKIEADLETFQTGDTYDVLTEIYQAVDDVSKEYKNESTIWSIIALKNPDSRFGSTLRRHAYYHALELWSDANTDAAKTIAAKAMAMAKQLRRRAKKSGAESMVRAYGLDFVPTPKKENKKTSTPQDSAALLVGQAARRNTELLYSSPVKKSPKTREAGGEGAEKSSKSKVREADGEESRQGSGKRSSRAARRKAAKASRVPTGARKLFLSADVIVDSDEEL